MAKILVVEDSQEVRSAIVELLSRMKHTVVESVDGREAIGRLGDDGPFDLVITDVLMPEADGIEVVQAVHERQPGTRVLAISGGAPNLPAGYALKMTEMFRADAVLYKPFLNEELRDTVSRLLAETTA